MADIGIERPSLVYVRWGFPSLTLLRIWGKRLRRKSRDQATAEAVVNRFGCDRWCEAIEREISHRLH